MSDGPDERYTTFREHAELREAVAEMRAEFRQIGPTLARIETAIVAKQNNQPPAADTHHTLLAMHDVAKSIRDAMSAPPARQAGGPNTILLVLAIVGAAATAFFVGKVFF